jgi:hypothetical protein
MERAQVRVSRTSLAVLSGRTVDIVETSEMNRLSRRSKCDEDEDF